MGQENKIGTHLKINKRVFSSVLAFILAFFIYAFNSRNQLHEVVFDEKNAVYSCQYKGSARRFTLCLPENFQPSKKAPLVIMLHGYGSNGKSFMQQTNFQKSANERGFAVVFVDGTSNPNVSGSSTGWISDSSKAGKNDADFLEALALWLQKNFGFDPSKTFAAGFSNGAFMCSKLALEKGKTFKAVASVAGMMPSSVWENRKAFKGKTAAFLQINGTKDDVTPMKLNGSAEFNPNPAMEEVMEYFSGSETPLEEKNLSQMAVLYKYSPSVQWVLIRDGYHSWPEEKTSGIKVNEVILDFFEEQSGGDSGR